MTLQEDSGHEVLHDLLLFIFTPVDIFGLHNVVSEEKINF